MAKTRQKLRLTTVQFTDIECTTSKPCALDEPILAALAASLARWLTHARAKSIAVGYSGGLDSTVLLHALATLASCTEGRAIEAIHVEHGLHPDSALWAADCLKFAGQLGIRVTLLRVEVKSLGNGIEDAARRARYRAIAVHTGPDVLLLTAHHQADQAETVLMKLLSGAGPRGAAGMQDLSERPDFLLARPFLGIAKAQIVAYAGRHGLCWIEDPSNQSVRFRRNHIRQLMPELSAIYPDAELTLSTYAEQASADRRLLEWQAKLALARCQSLDCAVLRLAPLHAEPALLQPWIVRAWLAAFSVHSPALVSASLALANAQGEYGEVNTKRVWVDDDRSIEGNDYVRRFDGCLYYAAETAVERFTTISWCAHAPLLLGSLGSLQFDETPSAVAMSTWLVTQRKGGERIQLSAGVGGNRPHRHALKDILQQQRVPQWQRKRLIILLFPDTYEVACVVGICASARFQAWLDMHSTRLVHNN